jgi:hypothetical protein
VPAPQHPSFAPAPCAAAALARRDGSFLGASRSYRPKVHCRSLVFTTRVTAGSSANYLSVAVCTESERRVGDMYQLNPKPSRPVVKYKLLPSSVLA